MPSGPSIGDPVAPTRRPGATSWSLQLNAGSGAAEASVANASDATGMAAIAAVAAARRIMVRPSLEAECIIMRELAHCRQRESAFVRVRPQHRQSLQMLALLPKKLDASSIRNFNLRD